MAVPAIEIVNLRKQYGTFTAVDGISLTVPAGAFFGFLGPNGAGKTTTINAMVGLVKISGGAIRLFGHDVVADWRKARPTVGLAPQEYNFDRYLSIRDILIYQAGYYGLEGPEVGRRADALLKRFQLDTKAREGYTRLSGGMKRRLTLARALIHEPALLILDEPTAGVDVELRLELWDFLRELNGGGMTIVLTTHYLEEAETLCNEIGIIEGGKLVALQSTASLVATQNETSVTITLDRPLRALPERVAARGARFEPGDVVVVVPNVPANDMGAVLRDFSEAGLTVRDIEFRRGTLQDVFLELTRR